ncbi:hypothetical protein BS50DRAFT_462306, partial [Corynespora cassiicola Philippines]
QQPVKDSTVSNSEKKSNDPAKKPRPKRPNYHQIHSKSLPLDVHPFPAFIPHNPISIVRVAITLLSQTIWRPKSHPVIHKAYFSPETQSIHVTDPKSIRALWEQGFWGKGSLSRSEPRWLDQEKRKRGLEAAATAEENTRNRREERRQFKLERAMADYEAKEQQRREEGRIPQAVLEESLENGDLTESPKGTLYSSNTPDREVGKDPNSTAVAAEGLAEEILALGAESGIHEQPEEIQDQEHLQLTFEEAFFLSYGLGVLEVYQDDAVLPPSYLFRLYATSTIFPLPENAHKHLHNLYHIKELGSSDSLDTSEALSVAPDNGFMLKYAVFHHFRSLGWVVRPGIKFAVDYLLYHRGPAFSHAEFAVIMIPSYSHSYWSETPERAQEKEKKESRDWWWLHRLNRVHTQVHKTLMLCYVEVPPPWDNDHRGNQFNVNIGAVIKQYKIREVILRRWSPSRNR